MVQENVNVQQVKQNTDMDSHEEKLHDVIIKSKIEDTKAVMKAKAREIEASKLERLQVVHHYAEAHVSVQWSSGARYATLHVQHPLSWLCNIADSASR